MYLGVTSPTVGVVQPRRGPLSHHSDSHSPTTPPYLGSCGQHAVPSNQVCKPLHVGAHSSSLPHPPTIQVAAGNKHSLAVSWAGSLYTWGRGADGQCGHGDIMRKATPKLVQTLVDLRVRVCAVAAGEAPSDD